MHPEVQKLIKELVLTPHPEGGFYKEIYRSKDMVANIGKENTVRNAATSIYYLLTSNDFSAWHRLKSDEIWNFYQGCPLDIFILNSNNKLEIKRLGNPLQHPECSFQVLVEANQWFAAKPVENDSYTLAGCMVAPGFDFRDFEMASEDLLKLTYPQYFAEIKQFIRSDA